jgi:hypothetical protein
MATLTRLFAQFIYGVMGAAFLAAGISTLLVNTGLLPDGLREIVLHFAQNNLGMLHVIQEFGTLLVFVGLLSVWFAWRYEQSRAFHWFATAYWALMALIHWFHVASPTIDVIGGLINTIPLALFLAIGLLRTATEPRPADLTPASPAAERVEQEQHA